LGVDGRLAYQQLLRERVEQIDSEAEEQPVRRRLDELDPEFVGKMTEKGLNAHAVFDFL
jgi:hypothetical protein